MFKNFYTEQALNALVKNSEQRRGWDFSKMNTLRQPVPWKYSEVVSLYLKTGDHVLDIGSYPGSWLQYCKGLGCNIVGVDIRDVNTNAEFYRLDILSDNIFEEIRKRFDVVLSDISPKKTGIKSLDQGRSLEMNLRVLKLLDVYLKKNN